MVQGGKAAKKPPPKKTPQTRPAPRDKENLSNLSDNNQFLPHALQQKLLDIFRDACFDGTLSDFEATLQEVKGHLYNRDFATAFGRDAYLQAYAARWSPSRALGYAQVFHDVGKYILESFGEEVAKKRSRDGGIETSGHGHNDDDDTTKAGPGVASIIQGVAATNLHRSVSAGSSPGQADPRRTIKLVCIGGGAGAEVVALTGWIKSLMSQPRADDGPEPLSSICLDVLCQDIARWDTVVEALHRHCVAPRTLSKYASAAAIAANVPLLTPEQIKVQFQQKDVLDLTPIEAKDIYADVDMVTIMFTLNEIYSASIAKTQRLLRSLSANMKPGALLLVVDSPGSYSAVTINGAEKKYPMQWLLDHTLLPTPGKKGDAVPEQRWEKLVSDDSRWFRLQDGLRYPIDLENMRYQVHLYRRCGS